MVVSRALDNVPMTVAAPPVAGGITHSHTSIFGVRNPAQGDRWPFMMRPFGCHSGAGGLKSAASRPRSSSKEVPLNRNNWVRQIHRWVSIIFTATVIANFVAMGLEEPPTLIVYSPLLPLFLLLFTGLYMFVLPYAAKWRGARGAAG
jgi:hypothetical protein